MEIYNKLRHFELVDQIIPCLDHCGEKIMEMNRLNYCNAQGVCMYKNNGFPTSTKYLFQGQNDTHQPVGYETSDLKTAYIDRQSLQSRLYTPLLTQDQMLRFMREK